MEERKKKNPFNKEKIYLVGAAVILGFLVIAGENSLLSSSDSIFGKVVDDYTTSVMTGSTVAKKAVTGEASTKPLFTDVAADSPYMEQLRYMYEHNIMKGYEDGTFRPDKAVNRAELLKIIIVAQGEPKNLNEHKKCFTDVNEEWFAPYGCYAKWKGWVKGYGDGGFHPSNDVTRAEALKMMLEAYGIELESAPMEGSDFTDLNPEDWFAPYVWTAEKHGYAWEWKEFNGLTLNNPATRLEIATAIYKLENENDITTDSNTPTI
jgi:hypothetical protein